MTDWRPIETAPKDGSVFVIVMAGEPESYEVGWYEPYYGSCRKLARRWFRETFHRFETGQK